MCVCVCVCVTLTYHIMYVKVREQLMGIGFLLPPCGF